MMRTTLFLLLATLLLVTTTAATPNTSTLDVSQIDKVLTAAHAAAGGATLDSFAAVKQTGSFVQNGGPPSTFQSVTDLRKGYSRIQLVVGPATLVQGYDGTEWTEANGSVSIVSLPTFVADAVTQAYLSSNAMFETDQRQTVTSGREDSVDGQQAYVLHVQPVGGSPADLYFDAGTYRLVKVVAQTADGVDTTTNTNFQTIQGVAVAMRSLDVNAAGTTTTVDLKSVQFTTSLDPGDLARPPYVSQGTLTSPASVPFVSDVAGAAAHIVVPVTLDGKGASLIFDSGGANFLLPDAAKRLGFQSSGGLATGGAGSKQQMTAFTRVSSVDFGGAKLANQNFIVTSLAYLFAHPRKNVEPEGLIGFEYLANFRITVDYAAQRMQVASFDQPSPPGGATLPFKSDGRHAFVQATIDGVDGYYLLDTGNGGGVVLNEPFVKEHNLFPKGGLVYQSPGGVGGGFPETIAVAKSFAFAGQTFQNVPVGIPQVSAGAFATRGVAGNLGARILSRFTVVFDYKAQTVTFIPNQHLTTPFRGDTSGLSLTQNDASAFEVTGVIAGSPAASAGIVRGDRVTAFAGHQVSSGYGAGDFSPYLTGNTPYTLTVVRVGASKTVTITPRTLLPPAQ